MSGGRLTFVAVPVVAGDPCHEPLVVPALDTLEEVRGRGTAQHRSAPTVVFDDNLPALTDDVSESLGRAHGAMMSKAAA